MARREIALITGPIVYCEVMVELWWKWVFGGGET